MRSVAVACLAILASLPSLVIASALGEYRDVMERGQLVVVADIENDSMLLQRDDGFYTSGLRLRSAWSLVEGGQARTWEWHIGQELYTASDINLPPARIRRNDRPYAGWLYAGLQRELTGSDGSYRRLGVDIGCMGPCAGGELTQKSLHSLLNQPQPQAWSTQLRNEFGVVLHGAWSPFRWTPVRGLDLRPTLRGRFGNIFTDAGAEVLLRAGRLNLYAHQPALYGYFRAGARAVGYNATLQGGYFSGSGGARTVAPRRGVGELELGITWQGAQFGLSAAVVRRGNEVADLPTSQGSQNFAKVQLVYRP